MGVCASRVPPGGLHANHGASHFEASPAGVGVVRGKQRGVKGDRERAVLGCFGGTKPVLSPDSPQGNDAAGVASPVARLGEHKGPRETPPVRTPGRAPIPRTASGGRGGRGPGGNGNVSGRLGHVEGDADPDGGAEFLFASSYSTKQKFLGLKTGSTISRQNSSDSYASDSQYADGEDILALSATRVRHWDEKSADIKSWQTYTDLRQVDVKSFVANFPQRERSEGKVGETKGALAEDVFKEPPVPVSLTTLAQLAAVATQSGDANWASCDEVRLLLTEDVVYTTMEGHRVCGREAVLEKMNQSVAKLAKRMGKSFGGGTDDGDKTSSKPLPKKASKVKVKSTGPTRSFDKKGKEVWIVLYAFDLLLMKVKVKETFKVDKFGKIKELTRARA